MEQGRSPDDHHRVPAFHRRRLDRGQRRGGPRGPPPPGGGGGGSSEDPAPGSGEVLATVAAGTREDARRAIEAAAGAFPAWSQAPPGERPRVLLAPPAILDRRADEVAGLLARETGCCIYGFGMFQLGFVPGLPRQGGAPGHRPTGPNAPPRPA